MLLAATLLQGGCMPHVLHGPRVEPGTTGMVSLTLGRNFDLDDANMRVLPSLYAGLRHGWVSNDSAIGFSLGAQVPPLLGVFTLEGDADRVLLATSYVDAYLEPRRAGFAGGNAGVGVLASSGLVMPYVQYGRADAAGEGWYTTQGVALLGGEWNEAVYWMPALAWRDVGSGTGHAVSYSLSGGIGPRDDATDWFVLFGFTAEFGLPHRP
jgi:hypothetical protein